MNWLVFNQEYSFNRQIEQATTLNRTISGFMLCWITTAVLYNSYAGYHGISQIHAKPLRKHT